MILTLRASKSRTPPRQMAQAHSVEPSRRPTFCDVSQGHSQDLAVLVASLRDISVAAHHALKMDRDDATMTALTARIEEIEHDFCKLGLGELARFARALKRKLEIPG
jgi:hypothetical protein